MACYRPRPKESVWEWAEKNVYLSEKLSPGAPGYYNSSLTPYTRALQETFTSPDWDEDITMKSSQVGFTEAVLNIIRFSIAEWPTNIIYAVDSEKEVKRIGGIRLRETLENCPATAERLPADKDKITALTYNLPSMAVYLAGGHASGAYSNKPAGVGIIDEADEHPAPLKGEPENVDLVRERLKTVPGAKLFLLGRPKTVNHVTYREYLGGTQEKYHVPCPHCGHEQELVFEQVKFDHCKDLAGEYDLSRILAESFYECKACKGQIRDQHKYRMNLAGKWVATNPTPTPRKRSRHISDLYSPFVIFGKLAMEFVEATKSGSLKKLQRFRAARLGLPSYDAQMQVSEKQVLACVGPYDRGRCLFKPALTVICADKQGDRQKWVKACFNSRGDLAVSDYGETLKEDELMDIRKIPVVLPDGSEAPVNIGGIDEGYMATEVRDFVQRSGGFFFALKGRAGMQVRITVNESKTPHNGEIMIVYQFDDDDFKKQLYINRIARREDVLKGTLRSPLLWLPRGCEERFISELYAESLGQVTDRYGFTSNKWMKSSSRANDWGDAIKMCLVIWYVLKHNFAEEEEEQKPPQMEDRADVEYVLKVPPS